jgi:hypothetical protein
VVIIGLYSLILILGLVFNAAIVWVIVGELLLFDFGICLIPPNGRFQTPVWEEIGNKRKISLHLKLCCKQLV